jgi:tRNA A-37 threonylcarbamoyl transferase component Bud32/tetratricopeptide (TPR) repeat protein
MVSPCPDESVLLDFAAGALDLVAREAVERHVDACHPCFEGVAALLATEARGPGRPAGRYAIGRVLGAGAMGTVYEAHDPVLHRVVALKVLRSDLRPTEQRRLRLLREAQSLARIRHPNVVSVFDAGEAGADVYIAMEKIDGEPLDEHLRRRSRPWREVVDLFEQAGLGLAAAHEAGIVHRDFKPANALVDARGRVVVTDFGLAASMELPDESPPGAVSGSLLAHALSATATRLGTPAYMAPEQFGGQRVTPATDQFAFCVALVEALGGKRPFSGGSVEAWTRAQAHGPDLTGLPGPTRLARALARGLAFDPGDRHPSMRALLTELRRCKNQRRIRLVTGVVVTAAGALLAGGWFASRPPAVCAAPLAEGWGAERRAAIEARLSDGTEPAQTGGGKHLRAMKRHALARLEQYATELAQAYGEVCPGLPRAALRGTPEQRGQWICLESRRVAFDALTARLSEAEPAALLPLLAVVAELDAVSECAAAWLALRDLPQPEDPALGARVQEVRLDLAVAWVKQIADDPSARAAIEALLQQSRELDYAPLQAELLARLAWIGLHAYDYELAARQFAEAYAVAGRTGHEAVASSAAQGLILAQAQLGRFDEARAWAEAAAPLHRLPRQRIELSLVRGTLATLDGELDEAAGHLDEASALWEAARASGAVMGRRSLEVTMHTGYADVLVARDDYRGARRHYERALQVQRELYGDAHATLPDLMISLAEVERLDGDLAGARVRLEEALAMAGELVVDVPHGWANLGEVQSAEGEFVGAVASYRRARETLPTGLLAARARIGEAWALARLGRHDESASMCAAALAELAALLGPDHPHTLDSKDTCRVIGDERAGVERG